jgi:AcrR family transcriptional regulator
MEDAPKPTRRQARTAETRAELVAAAARVFAREGFHGASLQQVAREAGYTTGAIYGHFAGKDELFLAVFETFAATRVEELGAAHDAPQPDAALRARALADQWTARQALDPAFLTVALEFLVHALRRPALLEAFAARQAIVRRAVGEILEQDADAAGVVLPLPAQDFATALREMGVGLAIARLVDPGAVPEALYGDVVETFYRLLFDRSPAAPDPRHEDTP